MNELKDMIEIVDTTGFDAVLLESREHSVLVLKHSTSCSVSHAAYATVQSYLSGETPAPVYMVKVIESRPLSNHIAQHFSVQHQSPQLLLVRDGKVVWNTSHYRITTPAILEALQQAG